MVRKINGALEKRMEHEQILAFEKEDKDLIKTTKYIVVVFSFFGMYKSYNEGTFFITLFPYALLSLYDYYNYSKYIDFSNKVLRYFVIVIRVFYFVTFFGAVMGMLKLLDIEDKFVYITFEQESHKIMRSYFLFIWITIYYLFMASEIYLPLKRKG